MAAPRPARAAETETEIQTRARTKPRQKEKAAPTVVASQVCTGDSNGLAISVWCEEAGLHWDQEHPNHLRVAPRGKDGGQHFIHEGFAVMAVAPCAALAGIPL